MSQELQRHGVCSVHGLQDAWECGQCSNLRRICGLAPTEDHNSCGKADVSQTVRVSKEAWDEFNSWKDAKLKAAADAAAAVLAAQKAAVLAAQKAAAGAGKVA